MHQTIGEESLQQRSEDRVLNVSWTTRTSNRLPRLLEILTKPDNIPIVGMLVAIGVCLWVWLRQALRNDRWIREGKEERIYEDMIR